MSSLHQISSFLLPIAHIFLKYVSYYFLVWVFNGFPKHTGLCLNATACHRFIIWVLSGFPFLSPIPFWAPAIRNYKLIHFLSVSGFSTWMRSSTCFFLFQPCHSFFAFYACLLKSVYSLRHSICCFLFFFKTCWAHKQWGRWSLSNWGYTSNK